MPRGAGRLVTFRRRHGTLGNGHDDMAYVWGVGQAGHLLDGAVTFTLKGPEVFAVDNPNPFCCGEALKSLLTFLRG